MQQIKLYFTAIILLLSSIIYAQKKEILILDSTTNLPIEAVNIYEPNSQEGTFSNADGKASLMINAEEFKISHINYQEKTIKSTVLQNGNTILLSPKTILLNEVIVSNFDLKKALNYVMEHYDELYENKPFEKECNFKETLRIDNSLKRLILTKLNWWSKTYALNRWSDLKLRLGSIDFSKNTPMDIFTDVDGDNTSSLSNYIDIRELMIKAVYLNTFLSDFIKNTTGLVGTVENSTKDEILVSFTTDWANTKDYSSRHKGKIVFDKESKAISSFTDEVEYKNRISKRITSVSKKEYSLENKNTIRVLNLKKDINLRWTLSSLDVSLDVNIDYSNNVHLGNIKSNLYVLKDTPMKKVNNKGLIDIAKPIYQNLPANTISTTHSILLSKEEQAFIDRK